MAKCIVKTVDELYRQRHVDRDEDNSVKSKDEAQQIAGGVLRRVDMNEQWTHLLLALYKCNSVAGWLFPFGVILRIINIINLHK